MDTGINIYSRWVNHMPPSPVLIYLYPNSGLGYNTNTIIYHMIHIGLMSSEDFFTCTKLIGLMGAVFVPVYDTEYSGGMTL